MFMSDTKPFEGKTVLVVEDEESQLNLMQKFFTREGFKVITCLSAAEAMAVPWDKVDLLFSDIDMPGTNGIALAQQFKKDRGAPIVLITGSREDFIWEGNRLDVADGFLTKPLMLQELRYMISKVLTSV